MSPTPAQDLALQFAKCTVPGKSHSIGGNVPDLRAIACHCTYRWGDLGR